MKKHLSVLMLFTRCALYKALLLMLAMAAAESALFALSLSRARGFFGLDTVLAASRLELVCAVFFLVLYALLCLTGCDIGGKPGYTIDRLRVSRRAVFACQAAHNAGMLVIFWAAQLGLVLAFCGVYNMRYAQPQAAMLAFYRSDFLHSLLPLADWSRFACVAAMLVSLAVAAACYPARQRRGQKPLAAFALSILCVQLFSGELGSPIRDLVFACVALFVAVAAARGVWEEQGYETLS